MPPNEQTTRREFAGGLIINEPLQLLHPGRLYQFAVSQTAAVVERNAVMGDVDLQYQW